MHVDINAKLKICVGVQVKEYPMTEVELRVPLMVANEILVNAKRYSQSRDAKGNLVAPFLTHYHWPVDMILAMKSKEWKKEAATNQFLNDFMMGKNTYKLYARAEAGRKCDPSKDGELWIEN